MRNVALKLVQDTSLAAAGPGASPVHLIDPIIKRFDPLSRYAEFQQRFPQEVALFKLVGIDPYDSAPVSSPYTGATLKDDFRNIGEHCLAVAHCAERIAEPLHSAGYITADDRDYIVRRALVHDLNKPYEIMRKLAQRDGAAIDVYSISAYQKLKPLLMQQGVTEDIVDYLVSAGSETGHNSLIDFVACGPEGYNGLIAGKIAEKIVHLADDMTFTSQPTASGKAVTAFLGCWERMLASGFIEKYPFLWTEGLAVSDVGNLCQVKDIVNPGPGLKTVGSYAKLQVEIANSIAREIQLLLEPSSQVPPENFVRTLVSST